MPNVDIIDLNNQKVGEIELADDVFGVEVNDDLIYEAVRNYQAGQRRGTASTKTRHEVAGSGKKLWRQKGTGRARMGSIRLATVAAWRPLLCFRSARGMLHHLQLAVAQLGERARAPSSSCGQLVAVIARLRPRGAAMTPQWRADGAMLGASGPPPPQLFADPPLHDALPYWPCPALAGQYEDAS